MIPLSLDTSVGEWVTQFPQTSSVFEKLQLDYCCGGGKSLAQACRDRHLDPQTVLAKLGEAVEKRGDPAEEDWSSSPLAKLCDHIEARHHAYLRRELPRLTTLIEKVVAAHGDRHPELSTVQSVYAGLRAELETHMMKEERVLFPAIRRLEQSDESLHFPFGSLHNPVMCMMHEHDSAGAALSTLRQLTRNYQVPEGACRTYQVMLAGLADLEADMHQHVHKENNILFPRAEELETERYKAARAC